MGRVAFALLLALAAAAPAHAEPPAPRPVQPEVDFDDDPEAWRSDFWERVLEPERTRYEALVELGVRQLGHADRAERALAEPTLREAIDLEPRRALAHFWLGRALAGRGEHKGCADELATARRLEPSFVPEAADWPPEWALDVELGLCQARGGALEAAERTFAALVERGVEQAIVLERLADVRMALGRLEDARVALERARRAEPGASGPEFGLAVAYDRDGDGDAARRHLAAAVERDPRLGALIGATRSYAPLEDRHYYLGLALAHVGDRPRALFHFRRYLAHGEGPWAARARVHLDALTAAVAGSDLAAHGSAAIDLARASRAVAAGDRALQACVAATPDLVLRVSITRTADRVKRARAPRRERRRDGVIVLLGGASRQPPRPGVRVTVVEQHELDDGAMRRVVGCVEAAAAALALPPVEGEAGSYVGLEFSVVAR